MRTADAKLVSTRKRGLSARCVIVLHETFGIDIGHRAGASVHGVGEAGWLVAGTRHARHQVRAQQHDEEGDRQTHDDRLQKKNES